MHSSAATTSAPLIVIVASTAAVAPRFPDYEVIVIRDPYIRDRIKGPDWEAFSREVVKIRHYRKVEFRENRVREAESARTHYRSIPESQFNKPTFVRRACGGRWRVMRP